MLYKRLNKNFAKLVEEKIMEAESIVITSHISPDDDSISSVLVFYYHVVNHLKVAKERVRLLYTGKRVNRWDYFTNFEKIEFVDDIAEYLNGVRLLVMLDGSGWKRISYKLQDGDYKGKTICIDHHPKPENIYDFHLIKSPFSSTAEILYHLFFEGKKLNKVICETLLLGILGDTGNFCFVTPEISSVFDVSEKLVKEGDIKIEELLSKYSKLNFNIIRALGILMRNSRTEEILGWPKYIFSSFSREEMKKENLSEEEVNLAEARFVSYLKDITNVSWGYVITPVKDFYSYSLRSLPGSVSCRNVMERIGFGGGHDRAAGGRVKVNTCNEALKLLTDWMKKNDPVLV